MNFLEAVRAGRWITRRGSYRIFCMSDSPSNICSVTRLDILSDDWEVVVPTDDLDKNQDQNSAIRFSLLELD